MVATNHQAIEQFMTDNKIEIKQVFIPFSQSRSFKKDAKFSDYNLNWKVTLCVNGRDVMVTDYSAGIAHCKSYKQFSNKYDDKKAIEAECNGMKWQSFGSGHMSPRMNKDMPKCNPLDVLHCLLMDADAIDYTFADWCDNLGYDSDSMKAKGIYDDCLKNAILIRQSLGDKKMSELRELFQGY